MKVYEIRILASEKSTGATVLKASYINDFAAVRAAESIADGRDFEVWRGLECLHAKERPMPVYPPDRPAA